MFRKLIATDENPATLILRLVLGVVFFPHGAQKLLGWFGGPGFSGTMHMMTAQLPAFIVFLVIMAESFGSLLLALGLLGRLGALGISCVMLGAIITVHAKNGFFMNWFG